MLTSQSEAGSSVSPGTDACPVSVIADSFPEAAEARGSAAPARSTAGRCVQNRSKDGDGRRRYSHGSETYDTENIAGAFYRREVLSVL